MNLLFHVRVATITDIPELKDLFRNTILSVNLKDYPPEETIDWASCGLKTERWTELITQLYFIVAVNSRQQIVGFASISEKGYLHSMFVHANFQHRGIASLLYNEIENYANKLSIRVITSDVSITAKPFFEKHGFRIESVQKQKANQLFLTNYKMSKQLKLLSEMTNEELWQLFPIILSEHKAYWAKNYFIEKQELENTIGKESIIRINHIGSTAVPGLLAKPTIDILLEIKDNTDTHQLINLLENSGYIYSPQPNNPAPHMMFMKGYTIRGFEGQAYHLHIRYAGDWDELYFKDYLITHPEAVREYAQLKRQLKEGFEHDRDGYTQAKTGFIQKITALARKDFVNRYQPKQE